MKTHVSTVDFAAENFDFFAGQNIITRSAATKVLVLLVYDPFASKKERYKIVQNSANSKTRRATCSCKLVMQTTLAVQMFSRFPGSP